MEKEEILASWQRRILEDIDELYKIKIKLLKLAAAREDIELSMLANDLHFLRCHLANTITLRFGEDVLVGKECGEPEEPSS